MVSMVEILIGKGFTLHTLIVLSAPPVINRVPVWSNVEQNTPASASSDPGCGTSSRFWKGIPVA